MKIGFVYNAPCDIVQIAQNPTDEASAAVCFLAMQLAKLGHDITIFSQGPNNNVFNVRCRHIEIKDQQLMLDPALLETDFAALIFKNSSPEFALRIKDSLPYQPKIYLWTAHDQNSLLTQGLANPAVSNQLNGIICVSRWQYVGLAESLESKDKITEIPYAISPQFENLYTDLPQFINDKPKNVRMAYIATGSDGLDILLDSFDDIWLNYEDSMLGIFTNVDDPNMQQRIAQYKGIVMHGALSKSQQAAEFRSYTILVNPTSRATPSNVPLLESMAAGLYPVTSNAGSNDEYCQGQGHIIPVDLLRSNNLDNFLSELLAVCAAQRHSNAEFIDFCFKRSQIVNQEQTWSARAKQWLDLLTA
ncbi:MAG TPA: glycosyltransferase [Gammaproteobacteria bacterium]|nr:glycosyltransferase [Gammaproteobacteria bacterium]